MLLARGQRQHVRALAVDVDGLADEAAGHVPLQLVLDDHEADVRAAELRRDAPGLPLADADVEAVLAGRRDDAERGGLADDGDLHRAGARGDVDDRVVVLEHAKEVRRLHGHGEDIARAGLT